MLLSTIKHLNKKLLRAEFYEREEIIDAIEVLEFNFNAMDADWIEESEENIRLAKRTIN